MTQEAGASKRAAQGGGGPDPLATPTLASLYESQGHADMADVIYSQLGRHPGVAGTPPIDAEKTTGGSSPASIILEKLLSFREAARRVREAGRPGWPDKRHGR
jgi:hypothetical protein